METVALSVTREISHGPEHIHIPRNVARFHWANKADFVNHKETATERKMLTDFKLDFIHFKSNSAHSL
jgi:hypothetical protein